MQASGPLARRQPTQTQLPVSRSPASDKIQIDKMDEWVFVKENELKRVLSPEELIFVRLQFEKNALLAEYPCLETRPEAARKKVKQLFNQIQKKKVRFPYLVIVKVAKTDIEKLTSARARNATELAKAACRARNATEAAKAACRARNATEAAKAVCRDRNATEAAKAACRARNATEAAKERCKARLSSDKYKRADRLRKAKKRRLKRWVEQFPQAPEMCDIHVTSSQGYRIPAIQGNLYPCNVGQRLDVKIMCLCFPASIFCWKKDGITMGYKEMTGGSSRQMKENNGSSSDSEDFCKDFGCNLSSDTDQDRSYEDTAGIMQNRYLPSHWSNKGQNIHCVWYFKSNPGLKREATTHLTLYNAKMSDAGEYSVQISNINGSKTITFRIDFTPILVRDIRLFGWQLEEKEVTVLATDFFRLDVEIYGGKVCWYKDGNIVEKEGNCARGGWRVSPRTSQGTQHLTVKDVKLDDAGVYFAKIETEGGQCVTSTFQVNVVTKPTQETDNWKNTRLLEDTWLRFNNLMCMFCHNICYTPASVCDNCDDENDIHPCRRYGRYIPMVICARCKAEHSHCRICKQEFKWDDTKEQTYCILKRVTSIGICSRQPCAHTKHSNLNLDSIHEELAKVEQQLQEANTMSVWEFYNSLPNDWRESIFRMKPRLLMDKHAREKEIRCILEEGCHHHAYKHFGWQQLQAYREWREEREVQGVESSWWEDFIQTGVKKMLDLTKQSSIVLREKSENPDKDEVEEEVKRQVDEEEVEQQVEVEQAERELDEAVLEDDIYGAGMERLQCSMMEGRELLSDGRDLEFQEKYAYKIAALSNFLDISLNISTLPNSADTEKWLCELKKQKKLSKLEQKNKFFIVCGSLPNKEDYSASETDSDEEFLLRFSVKDNDQDIVEEDEKVKEEEEEEDAEEEKIDEVEETAAMECNDQ